MGLLRLVEQVYKFLPSKFVKHYIRPFLVRRKQASYDAKKYFESWHLATLNQEFSDRITIGPNHNLLFSRYHYNKRIRSLKLWRDCARQAGLRINCAQRTRQWKGIITPENNVLILAHNR